MSTQCLGCKHLFGFGLCAAFPKGIPHNQLTGEAAHLKVLPGQVGRFVYELDTERIIDEDEENSI